MQDLITPGRAAQNPVLSQVAASNPAYLASLVSAASDAVRQACGRDFTAGSYSEYYSGGIYVREPLRLRQFPVIEVTRVAAGPRPALLVQNLDSATNQRATVETTTSALRLARVASAVAASNDLSFAAYPTIASLAAAASALGGGWQGAALGGFGNWPSADLKPLQGAFNALAGGFTLELYAETVGPFGAWPYSADVSWDDACASSAGWRLDEQTGELFARFPRGQLNIRIDYVAGFATVPPAVQEACVQLAQDLYQAGLVNNTLKKATLGSSSVELKTQNAAAVLSPKVRLLLSTYMDHAKTVIR